MVNFSTWIPDCDSNSFALLDWFISSDASICSNMAFPKLGNSDHVLASFPLTFCQIHNGIPSFIIADWDSLHDHLTDVSWKDISKLSAFAGIREFCKWVQVGIDVYLSHHKYQINPGSSPWFSSAWTAAIVHRNHVFCLHQQNKSSVSKVKFRQASNCCKIGS